MDLRPRAVRPIPLTANLKLLGPSWLLPRGPIYITAERSLTWSQVLINNGLQIAPGVEPFICTANYTPTMPKSSKGRRAELNDRVGDFIDKFIKVKSWPVPRYNVKVCVQHHAPEQSTGQRRPSSITASCSDSYAAKRFASHSNKIVVKNKNKDIGSPLHTIGRSCNTVPVAPKQMDTANIHLPSSGSEEDNITVIMSSDDEESTRTRTLNSFSLPPSPPTATTAGHQGHRHEHQDDHENQKPGNIQRKSTAGHPFHSMSTRAATTSEKESQLRGAEIVGEEIGVLAQKRSQSSNNLHLAPNGTALAFTQHYTPTCPDSGKGRRTGLNETTEEFINDILMCNYAPHNESKGKRKRKLLASSASSRPYSYASAVKRISSDSNVQSVAGTSNEKGSSGQSPSLASSNVPSTSLAARQTLQRFETARALKNIHVSTASQPAKNNSLDLSNGICPNSDDDGGKSYGDSGISNEELESVTTCGIERQVNPENTGTSNSQETNGIKATPAAKMTISKKISLRGMSRKVNHGTSSDSSDDEEQSNRNLSQSRNLGSFAMPPPPPPTHCYLGRNAQIQAAAPSAFPTGQNNVHTHHNRAHGQEVRGHQVAHENEESFDDQEEPVYGSNDDDNHLFPPMAMASIRTTASEDELDLREDGIVGENMEATVVKRLREFDNSYILRIRNELEILRLKNKKRYNRIVLKMPLSMHLLEEVFLG